LCDPSLDGRDGRRSLIVRTPGDAVDGPRPRRPSCVTDAPGDRSLTGCPTTDKVPSRASAGR
jgi:hypothetical protein